MPEVTGSSPVSSTIMKVSIFIDGANFYRSLQRFDESLRVDYDRLASWITQAVGGPAAIFAGAYYYVGVSADAPPLVEGFLKGLELRPGYFVRRELRVRRTGRCSVCGGDHEYTTQKPGEDRPPAPPPPPPPAPRPPPPRAGGRGGRPPPGAPPPGRRRGGGRARPAGRARRRRRRSS